MNHWLFFILPVGVAAYLAWCLKRGAIRDGTGATWNRDTNPGTFWLGFAVGVLTLLAMLFYAIMEVNPELVGCDPERMQVADKCH